LTVIYYIDRIACYIDRSEYYIDSIDCYVDRSVCHYIDYTIILTPVSGFDCSQLHWLQWVLLTLRGTPTLFAPALF